MNSKFPTYLKTNNTGDIGVNAVSTIVNDDMKFIFKKNNAEYDFGIDAYIEIVTEEGAVTGQVIGVQIKCGNSFFQTKTKTGFTFNGENKHLNYYCNSPFPIIIVICAPNTKECYWEHFLIEKTEKTKVNWKINIPKRNKFTAKSKEKVINLVGVPNDFSDEANEHWEMIAALKKADFVHYSIPKSDIRSKNIKPLKSFVERLLLNDEVAISLQGKVMISVDGYENDKRELWEIRDVRRWLEKAEPKIKYWFFFCANAEYNGTLSWVLACLTNTITNKSNSEKMQVVYETKGLEKVWMRNFQYLNELTERYNFSLEKNKEISKIAMAAIGQPIDKS